MDYPSASSGTTGNDSLVYAQWEAIHNPALIGKKFQSDEDGAARHYNIVDQSLKALNAEPGYTIFVDKNNGETCIVKTEYYEDEFENNQHLKFYLVEKIFWIKNVGLLSELKITSIDESRIYYETWMTDDGRIITDNGDITTQSTYSGTLVNDTELSQFVTLLPVCFFDELAESHSYVENHEELISVFYDALVNKESFFRDGYLKYRIFVEEDFIPHCHSFSVALQLLQLPLV